MSIAQLRQHTGPLHKELEDKLRLFETVRSKEDYVGHLARVHQWLKPMEEKLDALASSLPIDWPQRKKISWVESDLAALGGSSPAPASLSLPPCDSLAQCLGILYVLEGSSLGAQVISRHYADSLQMSPEHGLRYFSGYGEETGRKWRSFLVCLESHFSTHPETTGEIIESACSTFRSYANFIPRQHE